MTPEVDKIECSECGGIGCFDDGPKCGWSCSWCGGCFDAIPCERCAGTGERAAECDECGAEVERDQSNALIAALVDVLRRIYEESQNDCATLALSALDIAEESQL